VKRAPGVYAEGHAARGSKEPISLSSHYLSGVDLPLAREYPEGLLDEAALDVDGVPISAKARRDALLQATFAFDLEAPTLRGSRLAIPLRIENIGAGHRVPAGFSQEREIWVQLTVKDKGGRVLYEVGRVDRNDEDLRDKVFVRVNTNPNQLDGNGRPIGMFGADVRDGVDKPQWSPPPDLGGTRFTGKGLINFQNGFMRCVTCIGIVAADGSCQPGLGQGQFRADRFADGQYDIDTGECRSNLSGQNALFETYFPVGALDSFRGFPKAPDAIVDTRSVPPGVPISYTYDLDLNGARGPFTVEARLLFRAFPPYLIRAFADYERQMAALGKRPNGPSVDETMLKRIEVVELAKVKRTVNP
jgi:eukaryotic-like serine/threonine-protein kinase